MKRFILRLEKDWMVWLIAGLGAVLIFLPHRLEEYAPEIIGIGLLFRTVLSFLSLALNKGRRISVGRNIIYAILGVTTILMGKEALAIIGIVWAIISMNEVANEIDEMIFEKKPNVFYLLMSAASLVLAVLLLIDPIEHFKLHIQMIGGEIILSSLIRYWNVRHQAEI